MTETKLGLSNLVLQTEYRTGANDPIAGLYVPCIDQSIIFKRAVGYFRSSVYLVVGKAIIEFAQRGGKIQLICSPDMDLNDVETIRSSYSDRVKFVSDRLSDEIENLLSDESTKFQTRVLATLVSIGALEIKIALRQPTQGIYHEKIGIFIDANQNRVSFIGSANESWSGWNAQGNFESIEVFCSWLQGSEKERCSRHEKNFDNLWSGYTQAVETLPFPEAVQHCLDKGAFSSLVEALENIPKLYADKQNEKKERTLLPHQINAIEAWRHQNSRGVFEHATGSGKTFTALEAARDHLNKALPVLILVPSALLLKQWQDEVKSEFPDASILLAGDSNVSWRNPGRLRGITGRIATGPRIVISTMQTASTDEFRQSISSGSHLMLIADEVHKIGSPNNSKCMQLIVGDRLGLSATPKRYGDPEGTAKIFDYFGPVVPPPFTLSDAVKSGRLVEYEYYPHTVRLTADEAESWSVYTRRIGQAIIRLKSNEGDVKLSKQIKMMLIHRARIAKKASGKPRLAAEILKKEYEEGQMWLVYCEDSKQLAETMRLLREIGLNPLEYHTGMEGDNKTTLEHFRMFRGVLVSIQCLDEGVDIPSVTHALILASSQNPRQFIQRRGRVLRKFDGKYKAVIHDALVVPINLDDEPEQLSLLKSEFIRAIEFSNAALNRTAGANLRAIAREIGFDPDELTNDGIEEEESQ